MRTINFSKTRDNMGVKDIGRNSASEAGCCTLGTGLIIAVFHCCGTKPVLRESENKVDRGSAMNKAAAFKNQ